MTSSQPVQSAWQYCPRCGAQSTRSGVNPFSCDDCRYVHYFSPVSAVGAITTDPSDNVLLLIRGKDPGKGMFGLPGGFIDPGESAEEALHREVFEEVNLHVEHMEFLATFPNTYAFGGVIISVTDMFFSVRVDSFEGMAVQAGEIDAWHFCKPGQEELDRMAFKSNRLALELFLSPTEKA